MTELKSREATKAQLASGVARQAIAEANRRNAAALTAMGMAPAFQLKWRQLNLTHVRDWLAGSDATSGIGAFAKVFRMVLQSAVRGLGAYLAMLGEISGGAMASRIHCEKPSTVNISS